MSFRILINGMIRISIGFNSMFIHTKFSVAEFYRNRSTILSQNKTICIDLGSGRKLTYQINNYKSIILTDIDYKSLSLNKVTENRINLDLNNNLPFRDNSCDLITSEFVFEHISDKNLLIQEIKRILKSNGKAIILFSSGNAEFAILNSLLPEKSTSFLLKYIFNDYTEKRGHKVYYGNCNYNAIKLIIEKCGLTVIDSKVSYFSAPYFAFFPPLYFVILIWEAIINALSIKGMSSYVCFEIIKSN
ncbi:class I SAM-dependent methyltransferase [candidate division WOR-3 bacterium]|nr:class I SAM-dependent methyltransferase [candidate division WOR-3 bacterium]